MPLQKKIVRSVDSSIFKVGKNVLEDGIFIKKEPAGANTIKIITTQDKFTNAS